MDVIYGLEIIGAILAVLITSFVSYWIYLRRNNYWVDKSIPFDPPFPLLGTLYEAVLGKSFQDIDLKLYKKYGKLFGAYQGYKPCIYVAEPELLRSIFVKDFNNFRNRREIKTDFPIMDNMVSQLDGDEKWRNIRNTMSPAFSSGRLRNMIPIMSECAVLTAENFEKYSKETQTVNCKRLFGNFTLDLIANVAFGTKLDSHNDPDNEFIAHARKVSINGFSLRVMISLFFPKLGKKIGVTFLPMDTIYFFENVVNSIIKRRQETKEIRNDFLQIMIDSLEEVDSEGSKHQKDSADAEIKNIDQIKRNPLSKVEVLAQTIVFFLAGYDTTATTLTIATYYLAVNPDVQKRVHKEVDQIWSKRESLDADALFEAKLIAAVIDETLRLSPPATRLERTSETDYVLGDTGITVPKGMVIEIPTYAMHHDPEFFPEPEKFIPDRFLGTEYQEVIQYSYLPFGAGPRNCLARRLALMETQLCLLHLLKRFEFSPCAETKIPMEYLKGIGLLQPKEVILKVTKRS